MHLIGYWDEPDAGIGWIDPTILTDYEWDPVEKERVIQCLRNGIRLIEEMGYSWCRIDPSIPNVQVGNAVLTDGYWLWPEGLVIYLERFDIELPKKFLDYIRSRDYLNDYSGDGFDIDSAKISSWYWLKWCIWMRFRNARSPLVCIGIIKDGIVQISMRTISWFIR